RDPKSDRLHGSATLDLIDGSVTLEGPLSRKHKLYIMAAARVSWVSVFLPIFNRSQFQISPFYWDYQLALRYEPSSRDDLELFLFGSSDRISARFDASNPDARLNLDTTTYYSRLRLRWIHRFSPDTVLTVMPSIGGDSAQLDTGQGVAGVFAKVNITGLG